MVILKTPGEIAVMREGGRRLAKILQEIVLQTKAGVTQKEINKLAEKLAYKFGGRPSFLNYKNYPASLCVSVNNEVVHGLPKNREFKKGDIVGLDFGFWYKGLCTDMAITCGVGKISPQAERLILTTKKALELGEAEVRPGNYIGDISFTIQNYVEKQGFSVVRELVGHGVGKKVHEDPKIPNFGKKGEGIKLKTGMALALEPMVNMGTWKVKLLADGWTFVTADGKLSAHFEHTVAVTKDGYEVLTK
ncbi:MAG: type I methionyl aminopeptidase [Patescibacteria group bacterium]